MATEGARQMLFDRGPRAIWRIDRASQDILFRAGLHHRHPNRHPNRHPMDSRAAGQPCPACGTPVEKIQYLGGVCYFCPHCQG